MKNLQANALGLSLGLLGALGMLVLSLLALGGVYTGAYEAMKVWHLFYDLTAVGIIAGIVEAAVWSYVSGYLVALFYNKFAK